MGLSVNNVAGVNSSVTVQDDSNIVAQYNSVQNDAQVKAAEAVYEQKANALGALYKAGIIDGQTLMSELMQAKAGLELVLDSRSESLTGMSYQTLSNLYLQYEISHHS